MLKNSPMYKFLMRNTWLQTLLVTVPVLLLGIYIYSYMTDLSNINYMLVENDKVVAQELKDKTLYEVLDYEGTEDNYSALVKMDNTKNIECSTENGHNLIYSIVFSDEKTSSIVFPDNTVWKVPTDFLFDKITYNKDDNTYTLSYRNHEYKTESSSNELVYELHLTGLDKFKVIFSDETELDFEKNSNIQFTSDTEPYKMTVSARFEKVFTGFEIHYVDNLPTNNIYYSNTQGVFVQNLSSDFKMLFLRKSKFILMCGVMIFYLLLLVICHYKTEFTILGNRKAFALNFLVIFGALGLLLVFTFTIL